MRAETGLRIVGGTAIDPRNAQAPPEVRVESPPSGVGRPENRRDRTRFAFAFASAAVLHAALLATTLHNVANPEARATGGSSEIVVEGVTLVQMDSRPSPAAPDLPAARSVEEAEAALAPPDATAQPGTKSSAPIADSMAVASAADTTPVPIDRSADQMQADVAATTATDAKATDSGDIPATPVGEKDAVASAADTSEPISADAVATDTASIAKESDASATAAPDEIAHVARRDETPKTAPIKLAKPSPASKPSQAHVASISDSVARGPTVGKAGAGGTSPDERSSATRSNYQAQLAARLRRFRAYPAEAEERGLHGVVTVTFTLRADGALASASLAAGSGAAILDGAALAMVRRAAPFPPIPPELRQSSLSVTVPVRFDRGD